MSVGMDFRALIDEPRTTYDDVRTFLEGLSHAERREAIEAAGGRRRQRRLFELASKAPAIGVADLIPAEEKGPLEPVIFHGKNSLPTFSIFQKRFCRPKGRDDTLIGYNDQLWTPVTGPGYFTLRETKGEERRLGTVAIDYTRLPDQKPEGWPAIRPNERGFSRLVYAHMVDYLRPLAKDVFIGRAVRKGKLTENYFLLVREPLE